MRFDVEYTRRRIGQCGKVCFDKKDAETKKNVLRKWGKERYLRVYNCEECNAWHLTKNFEKQKPEKYKRQYGVIKKRRWEFDEDLLE